MLFGLIICEKGWVITAVTIIAIVEHLGTFILMRFLEPNHRLALGHHRLLEPARASIGAGKQPFGLDFAHLLPPFSSSLLWTCWQSSSSLLSAWWPSSSHLIATTTAVNHAVVATSYVVISRLLGMIKPDLSYFVN